MLGAWETCLGESMRPLRGRFFSWESKKNIRITFKKRNANQAIRSSIQALEALDDKEIVPVR